VIKSTFGFGSAGKLPAAVKKKAIVKIRYIIIFIIVKN
jgi:hypothetical protein